MSDHVIVGNVKIISVQWYKILWKAHLLVSWLAWIIAFKEKRIHCNFFHFCEQLGKLSHDVSKFWTVWAPYVIVILLFRWSLCGIIVSNGSIFWLRQLMSFLRGNGAFHINYSWIPKRCWEKWFWQDLKTDRWMDKKVTPLWFRFC